MPKDTISKKIKEVINMEKEKEDKEEKKAKGKRPTSKPKFKRPKPDEIPVPKVIKFEPKWGKKTEDK